MKKSKKIILVSALIVAALLILVLGMLFYYREQTFLEILPADPISAVVQIRKNGMDHSQNLPENLFSDFLDDLSEFQYKQVTSASGMDSFGSLIYSVEGKHIEIMFSNERGGSVLINDIDKNGKAPVYKVLGNNGRLEEIFDTYLALANE